MAGTRRGAEPGPIGSARPWRLRPWRLRPWRLRPWRRPSLLPGLLLGLLAALACPAAPVGAQDNPEPGEDAGGLSAERAESGDPSGGTPADTGGPRGSSRPPGPAGPPGQAASGEPSARTDHHQVVGRFGVGFFGIMQLPVLLPGEGAGLPACIDSLCDDASALAAPSLGVRYWLGRHLGVEAALGFHLRAGEIEVVMPPGAGGAQDALETFGLALHAGTPVVVADTRHIAFQLVPFVNLGIVSGTVTDPLAATSDWDLSGLLIELGARVGAELHFGFLDMPQLALQGTLGLSVRHASATVEQGTGTRYSRSRTTVQTIVDQAPWELFTGGITAIYYF